MIKLFSKYILTVSLLMSFACNNNDANQTANDSANVLIKPINPIDDKIQKESALKQFDALEKLLDNQNYRLVKNKDTSYIYFSRVNKFIINTYQYKMIQGDSAQLKLDTIQLNAQNKVTWKWKDILLGLSNATEFAAKFEAVQVKKLSIQLNRQTSNTLLLKEGSSEPIQLRQTITISDFLVKSYYDFQHGTNLASEK